MPYEEQEALHHLTKVKLEGHEEQNDVKEGIVRSTITNDDLVALCLQVCKDEAHIRIDAKRSDVMAVLAWTNFRQLTHRPSQDWPSYSRGIGESKASMTSRGGV